MSTANKSEPLASPAAAQRKVNILLVDDHEENLLATEVVLADFGHNLVKARSGKEALKYLLTQDFAVILLDVQMPDMDGFETAALMRERERSRHTPIIFMTAVNKGDIHVNKGYSVGAVDYIFKPISSEVLRAKVSVFVDLFDKTEQIKEQAEHLRQLESKRYRREMVQLRTQRNRFFDLSLDMMCIVRFDGVVKELNSPWELTLGFSKHEMKTAPLLDFFDPTDRDALREHWRQLQADPSKTLSFECRLRHKDGTVRWLLWSSTAFIDEKVFYVAAHDITRRKLAEEKYIQLNEVLEKNVANRTAQLETANSELEAFSYSVSHDLKSPLRKIEGFSQLLTQRHSGQLDAEGLRLLSIICNSVQRMEQLIDDLLSFSRLGRKEATFARIDMTALARFAVEDLSRAEPSQRVSVAIKPLPSAWGDRSLIQQIFLNLVSNAFKFTRHQPEPAVEISATPGDKENVYCVKDNGSGFDMQYVDKLFGVFHRLHSATEFTGTGIGLALVKRIVQRHGGRVWAEGSVNKGASFFFTLPAGAREP